uniref:Acetyltransferase n=1 Tax=Tetraselmis sp. GSL018 TaxID=582737 RepID=A0A061QUB4_9CHLO
MQLCARFASIDGTLHLASSKANFRFGKPLLLKHRPSLSSIRAVKGHRQQMVLTRAAADPDSAPAAPFHDRNECRIGVEIQGSQAYVAYSLDSTAKTLDLTHTFTPPELRGKGLASKVVKQAFEFAKQEGYSVIPTCTYIPKFVEKNPEWESLVKK